MKFLFLMLILAKSYAFTIPLQHTSGEELCNSKDLTGEYGNYVEVPVFYNSQSQAKTKIYSYTKKPFNHALPSIIFFTGGPGVTSRSTEFEIKDTNIIFFEQRGISCSIPANKELFLNPNFYSSEFTARDAKAILDFYGIKRATIYGQSYGTVPATIFASLFKTRTEALIIEGVIYEGNESLWHSKVKRNLIQQMFNQLSTEKQDKIITLSSNGKLPSVWFSKLAGMLLYMNNGTEVFNTFFDNIIQMDEENFISFVLNFFPTEKEAENFSYGDIMMGMIGCKELSMSDPTLSLDLIFTDRKLNFSKVSTDFYDKCVPLNLISNKYVPYRAINYPVYAKTYYFLGENDGATDIHQGMNHYRNVAKIDKTIIALNKGGHLPALGLLKDNRNCNQEQEDCSSLKQNNEMAYIFSQIAKGININQNDINQLNISGELKFRLTR